jgi:hypothetical protein
LPCLALHVKLTREAACALTSKLSEETKPADQETP